MSCRRYSIQLMCNVDFIHVRKEYRRLLFFHTQFDLSQPNRNLRMEPRDRNSRKRAYHWLIIVIAWIFLFLLALESTAYIIIGAWHLSIPRLENVRLFSTEIYRRELGFGILLVILGSFGLFICLISLVATIFLRLIFLCLVTSTEKIIFKSFLSLLMFSLHFVCG